MKGTVLAIDGGNSKTHLALVRVDGTVLALVRGPLSSPYHLGVDFLLPKHFERLALGVVIKTREADERLVSPVRRRNDLLDEVLARSDPSDLAGAERLLGRPYTVVGSIGARGRLSFALPVALPPPGEYRVSLDSRVALAQIDADRSLALDPAPPGGTKRLRVVFEAQS